MILPDYTVDEVSSYATGEIEMRQYAWRIMWIIECFIEMRSDC